MVVAWIVVAIGCAAFWSAVGYGISLALAAGPQPDPPGYVCSDSGVIPFRERGIHGAISAAECHTP